MPTDRLHYQCQNPGCPRRAPQCLTEPPACYTCGERMPAVEMQSCSESPLSGKAKVVADYFASLPSPFENPMPPSELVRSIPCVYIEGQLDSIYYQQDPDKVAGTALERGTQIHEAFEKALRVSGPPPSNLTLGISYKLPVLPRKVTLRPDPTRGVDSEEDRLAAVRSAAARRRSRSQNKP